VTKKEAGLLIAPDEGKPMPGECRIHHVAIVVEDIDGALGFWTKALGLPLGRVEDIPDQESTVAFLPTDGGEVELVRPTSEDSGISRFLKKRGPGIHHLCFEVDDLDARVLNLREAGIRLIDPEPTTGSDGRRMIFVHPESTQGVLVELYETTRPETVIRLDRARTLPQRVLDRGRILAAGAKALWRSLRNARSQDD
jgi:methylmalonyl-CoA/ethylmalonyl-CoA epimerase